MLAGHARIAVAVDASEPVGQWERFEATIRNDRPYRDPFRDVTVAATYTRPDGSVQQFWGFYDGDHTWRIRFMPDQVGTWRYAVHFSDGSASAEGNFRCIQSDTPGMVAVYRPNPIWFGFRTGAAGRDYSPLLIRSFHVGDRFFARNWPDEDRRAFLDWANQQGYNTLSIASHYLNRNTSGRGAGWDTPRLWPPNPAEYQRMERILDDLAARRIIVFPFAGFFGRSSEFPRDGADQELYIRYTLARVGSYWNVLLNVAGPESILRGKPYLTADQVNALGSLIHRLDVFDHPLTVHNPTGDDFFRDADWESFGTLQGPKTIDRAKLSAGLLRNHHAAKPLYAQETLWPGNTQGHPKYTDDDVRKNAYVILLSGATLNFADMAGDSSSGFSGTLDLSKKIQSRHDIARMVWDFFQSVPFHRMAPRQDLTDKGFCLAEPGRWYLNYLPAGGGVTLKLTGEGPYRATWVNARGPADRHNASSDSRMRFEAPDSRGDWLLEVRYMD